MSTGNISLRRGFSWNLAGVIVYNLSQSLLIIVLAQLGQLSDVGTYAFAMAVAAPIYLFLGLNLRIVLATDAARRWSLIDALRTRQVLSTVAFVVTVAVGVASGQHGASATVIVIVALAKGVEALGQTLYGYFQLRGRLDLVAKSMLLRAGLGSTLFTAGFAVTRDVTVAASGLLTGWLVTQLLWDRPQARELATADDASKFDRRLPWRLDEMKAIARRGFPLGLDAGLVSFTQNAPRYVVQALLGPAALGVFAALAYATQAVSMITGALADGVVTQLAHHHAGGRGVAFSRLLLKLVVFGAVVGGVAILLGLLVGEPALTILLGEQYADVPQLVTLLVAAALATISRSLARALQASHRFSAIAAIDAISLVTVVATALALVPDHGLMGAASSLVAGGLVCVLLSTLVVLAVLRSDPKLTKISEKRDAHLPTREDEGRTSTCP